MRSFVCDDAYRDRSRHVGLRMTRTISVAIVFIIILLLLLIINGRSEAYNGLIRFARNSHIVMYYNIDSVVFYVILTYGQYAFLF